MNLLRKSAFEASREFLEANGRPLEIARFRHAFLGASPEDVLDALGAFRNDDGGFGRALEPDVRAPESSALCTSIAFQVLRSINASPEAPLVSDGIDYLMANLDVDQCGWRIIPETAENSPRAPWWYQKGREERFAIAACSLNPTAELLGYLIDYGTNVPADVITSVANRVAHELDGSTDLEMHDLLCCLRLLQTAALPEMVRSPLLAKLHDLVNAAVARDPSQWEGYSLRPLQVVDSPHSPLIDGLHEAVAQNLDYEIATQNPDGSWTPTWSWDDAFPAQWATAKAEWSGIITLEKLLVLRNFGRIEGIA